jgi:hypothetical protein
MHTYVVVRYRFNKVFNSKTLQVIRISDLKLIIGVMTVCFLYLLAVFLPWMFFGEYALTSASDPGFSYPPKCRANLEAVFIYLSSVFHLSVSLASLYFVNCTRKIP